MSIESAKAFLMRMNEDEAFKNKILAIEDVDARLACVKAEGFEFTLEEIDDLAVEGAVGGMAEWPLEYPWKKKLDYPKFE